MPTNRPELVRSGSLAGLPRSPIERTVVFRLNLYTQTSRFGVETAFMSDNIEHLILEQFRAPRNQIEGMQTETRSEFSDVKHRINRLESGVAGIRRYEAGTAEDIARQQATIDSLTERIQRIERRLELTSGPKE